MQLASADFYMSPDLRLKLAEIFIGHQIHNYIFRKILEFMNNLLQVDLSEFKEGLKPFRSRKSLPGKVLLSFENGLLSFEFNGTKKVMRATGHWNVCVKFSADTLRALALVPPGKKTVTIAYAENCLLIEGMTIACTLESNCDDEIEFMVGVAKNFSIIDFLAMDRASHLVNVDILGISQKIRVAKEKMERRVKNASAQLIDLEITENDIRELIDRKIEARIKAKLT